MLPGQWEVVVVVVVVPVVPYGGASAELPMV